MILIKILLAIISYLKDNNGEDKETKWTKRCVIKRNLILRDYKNYLKESQIEKNEIFGKEKIDVDCLKVDKKEFLKDKIILKTQQGFKSKRHNLFTEVITKIALSSNNDKRMQSINSIEIYAYGTTKDLTCKKKTTDV